MSDNFREHVSLGRTGLNVSRLGIGSGYGAPSAAIEKAFHEHGINYFYQSSPRRAGMRDAVRNLARNHREKIVVALQTYDRLGMLMQRYLEKGLREHGIEYCDVLILGWFNRFPGKRIIDAALRLKEQGKVKFLAMSGHRRTTFGEMAAQGDSPVDIFQVRYNAVHTGAEKDIFPHLPENKRPGITIYTATCWKKLLKQSKMPEGEKPLTAPECYRFVLSHPDVDLCMTGAANAQQIEEAATALDGGPLNDEEMARIRRIGAHIYGKKK